MITTDPVSSMVLKALSKTKSGGNKKTYKLPKNPDGQGGISASIQAAINAARGNAAALVGSAPDSQGAISAAFQTMGGPQVQQAATMNGMGPTVGAPGQAPAIGGQTASPSGATAPGDPMMSAPDVPQALAAPGAQQGGFQLPPGLLPSAPPQYNGSNVGHNVNSIGQIGALLGLLGLASPEYLGRTIPFVQQASREGDQQRADADYAHQQQDFTGREQLAHTLTDAAQQNSLEQSRLAAAGDRDSAQKTKDLTAYNTIFGSMYKEMKDTYDPRDPEGSRSRQKAILDQYQGQLKELNPSFNPQAFFGADGSFTAINALGADKQVAGINSTNTKTDQAQAQIINETLAPFSKEGFWSLDESARQSVVHMAEDRLGLQRGDLGVPTDGQSFKDKLAAKKVDIQGTQFDKTFGERVKHDNAQDKNAAARLEIQKQHLDIEKEKLKLSQEDTASLIKNREYKLLADGKNPNALSIKDAINLYNTAVTKYAALRAQADDAKKSRHRNSGAEAELARKIMDQDQLMETLKKYIPGNPGYSPMPINVPDQNANPGNGSGIKLPGLGNVAVPGAPPVSQGQKGKVWIKNGQFQRLPAGIVRSLSDADLKVYMGQLLSH